MSRQITFEWKRWMSFGALACVMFNASYFMAATIPSCPDCGRGDVSGIQVFHWVFLFAFAVASVVMFIAAIVHYCDGK